MQRSAVWLTAWAAIQRVFLRRFNRHRDVQCMAGATAYDAAHRRDVKKVAACGQRYIVFAGHSVVGRVKVEPAPQVRAVNRCPGVRRVTANQARHALRWMGQHVPADIAGGQTHVAKARNHDVREVLADTLALTQRVERRCVDLGAVAFIGHGGVNKRHQFVCGLMQGLAGCENGLCKLNKGVIARYVG